MVRALIEGRKTMTRRILKPQPIGIMNATNYGGSIWSADRESIDSPCEFKAPRFAKGDRLWVREAWKSHSFYDAMKPRDVPQSNVFYLADRKYEPTGSRGRPSIFMPRWASRLTLIVTGVKVERVQAISEDDAKAEGCDLYVPGHGFVTQADLAEGYSNYLSPRMGFETVWTEINGADSWAENPWIVAVKFKVFQSNIDQVAA